MPSPAANNTVVIFSELFESHLEALEEEELQELKSLLAARANIHQTVYQDGLRKRPPVNHVKNGALSEMYANIAFYAEAVRIEKYPPPPADEAPASETKH